jgi:hypothetical protein
MPYVGLFSSDARPKYIEDIQRIISSPKGYVHVLRYRKKYIATYYTSSPKKLCELIDQNVVVVFSSAILKTKKQHN